MQLPTISKIVETYVVGTTLVIMVVFFVYDKKLNELSSIALGVVLYMFWAMGAALVVFLYLVGSFSH